VVCNQVQLEEHVQYRQDKPFPVRRIKENQIETGSVTRRPDNRKGIRELADIHLDKIAKAAELYVAGKQDRNLAASLDENRVTSPPAQSLKPQCPGPGKEVKDMRRNNLIAEDVEQRFPRPVTGWPHQFTKPAARGSEPPPLCRASYDPHA